ncbi:MAG: hypothetical protein GTN78_02220 [Gemmatimonadales bacterium]|nr:hypothetical protein [Gemmatimonadales bacterium]NIN10777.1 hypothetical protein [Gemmatimonadales bacterium]NIQ99007.1 hypothetical protein [Gemmatimonadales bacterium]NIS63826.1 hypothetical protein [Gemmatimonadales bacterium]
MAIRTLPIFPLPLVLFPGTPQLLHIFEPRYRQVLADCQDGDRRFGISFARPASAAAAPEGHADELERGRAEAAGHPPPGQAQREADVRAGTLNLEAR